MKYLFILLLLMVNYACLEHEKKTQLSSRGSVLQIAQIDSIISYKNLVDTLKTLCHRKYFYESDSILYRNEKKTQQTRSSYHRILDHIHLNKKLYVRSMTYYLSVNRMDTISHFKFSYTPAYSAFLPVCDRVNEKQISLIVIKNIEKQLNYFLPCIE